MSTRVIIPTATLALFVAGGLLPGKAQAQVTPLGEVNYCYECDGPEPGTNCMDCWHPVPQGHVSCVPTCMGYCRVGAGARPVIRPQ